MSQHPLILNCGGRQLNLTTPQVMGIINVTPDSFSDGGQYQQLESARRHAAAMAEAGAAMIDIGGESTRPGAAAVSLQEELDRTLPVIEAIHASCDLPISIDSSKPAVMRAAAQAGAGFINDINALQAEGALTTAAQLQLPVCLMHKQGTPHTMQQGPHYDNVVSEVQQFLAARLQAALDAGLLRQQILLDPGFGFGKSVKHNLTLMQQLATLNELGQPLLIGISRKSMLGAVLDRPVNERLYGAITLTTWALLQGAKLIRSHDVAATVDCLKMLRALQENRCDTVIATTPSS
ncbi:MAG: dihydropteroate synthase [Gammaproteobacteria bacterium]|nr:dihydropteroate synthase [Gammaproteobacteria bacterium]